MLVLPIEQIFELAAAEPIVHGLLLPLLQARSRMSPLTKGRSTTATCWCCPSSTSPTAWGFRQAPTQKWTGICWRCSPATLRRSVGQAKPLEISHREHFSNSLGVPKSTCAETDRYLSALQSCYAAQVSNKDPQKAVSFDVPSRSPAEHLRDSLAFGHEAPIC